MSSKGGDARPGERTSSELRRQIEGFDPDLPLEEASTPPSSWYLDPAFALLERRAVFAKSWQLAARADQLGRAGAFVAGRTESEPWVVLRHPGGGLRALANVCRHHAAEICAGEGTLERLVCPYHGWTYDLDGRLIRAPELGGARGFEREAFRLPALGVGSLGPLVLVSAEAVPRPLEDLAPELALRLEAGGWGELRFAQRRTYDLACDWKVFVDNYLDGGYHVAHAHPGLAAGLELGSYRTEIFEHSSIQSCRGAGDARIGAEALYGWVFPNLMINRYGPVMDTNLVLPAGAGRSRVVIDFWFEAGTGADFAGRSIEASEAVQREDVLLCESVQRGLCSRTYERGRYSAAREGAMHHFHRLLAAALRG